MSPQAPCLGDDDAGWLTAAAVERAVEARLGAARAGGIHRHPMHNSVGSVIELLALLTAGRRVLLENPAATTAERARAAALHAGTADGASPEGGGSAPETAGVLLATSGSTGAPKLVRLAAGQLVANGRQMGGRKGLGPGDRILCAIPTFHANGLVASLFSGLVTGAAVWLSGRLGIDGLSATVAAREITMVSGVPTLWQQLVARGEASRRAFASVRMGSSGAAPLSVELAARAEDHLDLMLLEGYGLSEATCGVCGTLPDDRRPGWVGPPLDGTEVRIADPETGSVLPAGKTGEIQLRGPQVMEGYHRDPAATAAAFVGDWLRTGDLGELSADGVLRIVGRLKHLIIRSGFNVVPREVEEALAATGLVEQAAVFGRPHPEWGEEVCAVVVPAQGTAAAEPAWRDRLAAAVRERLSGYKCPTTVAARQDLLLTPAGKPDYEAMRATLGEE